METEFRRDEFSKQLTFKNRGLAHPVGKIHHGCSFQQKPSRQSTKQAE